MNTVLPLVGKPFREGRIGLGRWTDCPLMAAISPSIDSKLALVQGATAEEEQENVRLMLLFADMFKKFFMNVSTEDTVARS